MYFGEKGQTELKAFIESKPDAIAKGAVGLKNQRIYKSIKHLPNILKLACILSKDKGILHVDENGNEQMQTNTELFHSAKCILSGLRAKGLKPGDQVILQVDHQPSFLTAFWGTILGGFVAVPLPLPWGYPVSEGMDRITKVCNVLDNYCILTDQKKERYKDLGSETTIDLHELQKFSPDKKIHKPKPDDTAIILFSSGSTGDPKGVILTHKNILHALESGLVAGSDVPKGDIRSNIGYSLLILRRLLFKNKGPKLISRSIIWLSQSPFSKHLNKTKTGKYLLDTLLILNGNKVSVNLELTWDDIIMANWMPYSHVVGLIGLHLGPTLTGFTQVALSPKTFIENPTLFIKLIHRYRISFLGCPNFAIQWLTTQVADEDIEGVDLSCIVALNNTAEPISPDVTRKFIEKFSKYGFSSKAMCPAYGMSEATAEIVFPHLSEEPRFHEVDRETFVMHKIIIPSSSKRKTVEFTELGAPVQAMEIRIVDDNDVLLRENMVGHVQIKGHAIISGYYKNQEANNNMFCNGWLKTGDMGFLITGKLVLTGRQKDIVFVHGQNLYANDIENQIAKVPGMEYKEFAVSSIKHYDSDSEKVVLFINTSESMEAMTALLSRINSSLIASMGIKLDFLVPLDEFPRTPTAKIKRFKLKEQFENNKFKDIITAGDATAFNEANREAEDRNLTQTEKHLIKIWKDVTEKDSISKFDNFFDLGGNSLKATKVISRIREELKLEIPIKTIFEYQTIIALAAAIETMNVSAGTSVFPPIEPLENDKEYYDVSHAQKRLWYLDQVVPDSAFYNIPGAVMVKTMEFDYNILKKAFKAVIERHESLRTTFHTIDNKPVQVIAETMEQDIPIIDLSSDDDQDKKLVRIIENEKFKSFNLKTGPLFRTKLVKLSKTKHAFIIIMHHIISDGWSMGLLFHEAMQNYLAFITGNPSPFPELTIQYKDFSLWQNAVIKSKEMETQKNFWKETLSGDLPILNLPIDRPRPVMQTQNGGTRRLNIDKKLSDSLKKIAKKLDVTPFMLTLAVLKILLHKLTGQEDIIVGSPIAGRNNKEIEPLVGFFVNMLPLRSKLTGNPKFTDLLDNIKQTSLSAYTNQDYPFDKLVELINPTRDMSRSPIFDVVFEYRDAFADTILNSILGDESITDITGDDPMAKFDMFITLSQGIDSIIMQFEYNKDLFNDNTIDRMMTFFITIMTEVINNPEKRLADIEILEKRESEKVLFEFNATEVEFPDNKCIHKLFQEQARQYPDKEALIFGEVTMTYGELNERSNRIAHYLKGKGVGRGTYVALMVERSFDMIVSVLGILKAGGAYVPIEQDYPIARIKYMLDDIQAPVVIVHESLADRIPDVNGDLLCLEEFWKMSHGIDNTNLSNINKTDDIAYIIYTSGSTGKPKGVMVPHIGVARLVKNTNFADITPDDRFLQIATFAFDAATLEFWGPLLNGGTLVLASKNDLMSPDRLADLLLDNDITIIFLTVVLYNQLVDSRPDGIAKLKRLLVGGEALSVAHIRKGLLYAKKRALANGYGPTENTTFSCFYEIDAVPDDATSIPIGYPLANSTVYILDEHFKPVPIGVPGEIFFGGHGLAKGYLNDPDKTAMAFIDNPIPHTPSPILYKSGDLGKWLPDGSVDFLGRIDHQVKIRGHRVELGEIEAALRKFHKIDDCVVIVKAPDGVTKKIFAYYVSGKEIPIDRIRSFLGDTLPGYMIPNLFMRLDTLPLNRNGKVDKAALPEHQGLRPEMEIHYIEPSNDIENTIAKVWEEVLCLDKVGIYDNFFDLGGDSIISIQIVSRLNQMKINLKARDMLLYQTIAELSNVAEIAESIQAEQGPVTGTALLTPIQQWFFDQRLSNKHHFNQALMFCSKIPLDETALEKGLNALIDHHDALRMRFSDESQENCPVGERILLVVENIKNQNELFRKTKKLQTKFNIAHGPIFGAGLFRKEKENYLVLAAHHLVVDGVSWRILLEDLFTAYSASLVKSDIILPRKTTSFTEWANRINTYTSDNDFEDEIAFWNNMLSIEMPKFKTDHNTGPNDIGSMDKVRFELNPEDTHHLLKDIHKSYNTEINDILITALMRAQTAWTGHDRVIFNLEGHGREDNVEDVDISRTVGWFTTIFPLMLNTSKEEDIAMQIKYTKEKLHQIPHRGFNFGALKYLCNVNFQINRDISFNYLGQAIQPSLEESFSLKSMNLPGTIADNNIRPYLIDVICVVIDNCFRADFLYSKNRHTKASVEKFSNMFRDEILQITDHCLDPDNYDITPSDFNLIDIDQKELNKISDFV